MTPLVRLTVKPIPKKDRVTIEGVEIAYQWTLEKPGVEAFTSGSPSEQAALEHARELAAAHGYTPEQIEEL